MRFGLKVPDNQLVENKIGGGKNASLPHKTQTKRIFGLDLIRVFASLFTIAGHFFSLHTQYMDTPFVGASMFVQGMAQMFFRGTPFFMLLSGYLLINKAFDNKYYHRGKKVIISYLFFSLVTILFRVLYMGESCTVMQWGMKILDFTAIPYGWYIEMWIGLFLLSPFINIMYHAIPTRKQKLLLIAILFGLSCMPLLTNRYGLSLLPEYWVDIYPLFFYLAGAYIREYRPIINKWLGISIVLGICLINPVFNILFANGHDIIQIAGGPTSAFGAILAVVVFLLFYQLDVKNMPLRQFVSFAAKMTLSIYLCCYIFDMIYYPWFKEHFFISQAQFGAYFFIIVPLVFFSSMVVAWIKDWLFRLLHVKA